MNVIVRNIEPTAATAIDLQKQINDLTAKLDPLKVELRLFADGETETITIPGKGKVAISKPALPSSKEVLEVDEARFLALDPKAQQNLLKVGVIKRTTKTTNGSAAKVTISPNA